MQLTCLFTYRYVNQWQTFRHQFRTKKAKHNTNNQEKHTIIVYYTLEILIHVQSENPLPSHKKLTTSW